MFLRLNPDKADITNRRLFMSGFEFGGELNADYEHTYAGVRLLKSEFNQEEGTIQSIATVACKKHALVVAPNPELGRILGRQPGAPTVLSADDYSAAGPLELTVGKVNKEQATELAELPWLAELYVVPVTTLND